MALLQDLVNQIDNVTLRERILEETNRILKHKKFGIVFEEHTPECATLIGLPIQVGAKVALRSGYMGEVYIVIAIDKEQVTCIQLITHEKKLFNKNELVVVAEFGEPIYPSLELIDYIENAPDSNLWHALIEADNYHALQLLAYLYRGKVDCIYIDPPYNSGARDWKYNNDYVDKSDMYRHSKWLSMMAKRLKIAKKLLKYDGVLAIAIDQNEIAHLMCLLEEPGMFSEYDMTVVTVVHNPRGNVTANFAETNEYVIYLIKKGIKALSRNISENEKPRKLRRWGQYSLRTDRKSMFYPIYVKNGRVIGIGEQPQDDFHPNGRNVSMEDGVIQVWPIDQNGIERRWNYSHDNIKEQLDRIIALPKDDGIDLFITSELSPVKTVWIAPELDAGGIYGSSLVEKIVGDKFPYPKSLYTVVKTIEPVIRNRPNALIVDFFAGSGTTLHAVNLINLFDQGNRRCIMVTNNEYDSNSANVDGKAENLGICRTITWPRTKFSILGKNANGENIEGEYIGFKYIERNKKRSYFPITFVSENQVNNVTVKKQLLSLIGKEKILQSGIKADVDYIIPKKSQYTASILFNSRSISNYLEELKGHDYLHDFYIVCKNSSEFKEIREKIQDILGDYWVSEREKIPMKLGFKTNAVYFKIKFLNKNLVSLGRQLKELIPVLWMKSGAIGKCPELKDERLPAMLIWPKNRMAILIDESYYREFNRQINAISDIQTIFIVTNSESAYREMVQQYDGKECYQLYRNYLDNFRINVER